MKKLEFQLHIDASLLSFRFNDPCFATVQYFTYMKSDEVKILIIEIGLGPVALSVLNNAPELLRQAEAAVKHNAQAYWASQSTTPTKPVHSVAVD